MSYTECWEKAGVKTVHEISRCKDYEEYQTMAEANFNLVLHPEARFAAEDFHEKLRIPFIELRRLYQIDKITKQYQALGNVLGIPFEDHEAEAAALDSVKCLKSAKPDAVFAIGECMNGDPFELALALVKYGFRVAEIYGTLTAENFVYLKNLSELSPQTKVFSNMEPTMLYYDPEESGVTITIGKDACYYHPDVKKRDVERRSAAVRICGCETFVRKTVGGVGDERIKKISDTICTGSVGSSVGVI